MRFGKEAASRFNWTPGALPVIGGNTCAAAPFIEICGKAGMQCFAAIERHRLVDSLPVEVVRKPNGRRLLDVDGQEMLRMAGSDRSSNGLLIECQHRSEKRCRHRRPRR